MTKKLTTLFNNIRLINFNQLTFMASALILARSNFYTSLFLHELKHNIIVVCLI